MRSFVLLSVLSVAASDASIAEQGQCLVDSGEAVSDIMDASLFMWAASKRCGKKAEEAKCAVDVSAAIKSVNSMANVILKAVDKCGNLEGENTKCGLQIGVLTKAFAGLAASSSGVVAKCPGPLNAGNTPGYLVQQPGIASGNSALASAAQQNSFAQCLVDVKDATKSLFKATKRIIDVKENCDGENPRKCAHNSLKIVAAFAAMGEYLAGALGRCSANTVANAKLRADGQCAQEAESLVRHTSNTARASMYLQKYCIADAQRLFELEDGSATEMQSSGSSITLALAAVLPLTAVLGFVGGSRFAKSRVAAHGSLIEAEE